MHVVKSPRLGFVTITDVEVSSDLKYARIFYSTMGSKAEKGESARALERTKGVVQAELGKTLRIRQVPIISYHVDRSLDYGERIDSLLDRIRKERDSDDSERGD